MNGTLGADLELTGGSEAANVSGCGTIVRTGAGSASGWTVRVDGEVTRNRRVRISGNKLQVVKDGLMIFIR